MRVCRHTLTKPDCLAPLQNSTLRRAKVTSMLTAYLTRTQTLVQQGKGTEYMSASQSYAATAAAL